MNRTLLNVWVLTLALLMTAGPVLAQGRTEGSSGGTVRPRPAGSLDEATKDALNVWEDFLHYQRVAQLDLAVSQGKAFIGLKLDSELLLSIVDDLSDYPKYEGTLLRSSRMEGEIAGLASDVMDMIAAARLDLAREGPRVRGAIERLDDGLRARLNAQAQLKRAGQYAAPQLLAALLSTSQEDRILRPYVMDTMVLVGRSIVAPLSQSLEGLPAVAKQQVAEVLGRIGYPMALPYLKAELVNESVKGQTRETLQTAYDRIIEQSGIPAHASAAELLLMLAEDYYRQRSSLILEPKASHNLLWSYSSGAGLTYLEIPTAIFFDVQAMRAAKRSLVLDSNLSTSYSLWLAANLRRENNLDAGGDPSYGSKMRAPMFYATLAGPDHQHAVLARGLGASDAALIRDAIAALANTSGADSLVHVAGDRQPLISALNYPDRRVRFEAAFAIANSEPRGGFAGAERITPLLADAVRQSGKKYALVIATNTEDVNTATQYLGGYTPLVGETVEAAEAQIVDVPGVDVILVHAPASDAIGAIASARNHYKLMGTPIVVLGSAQDLPAIQRAYNTSQGIFTAQNSAAAAEITESVKRAVEVTGGDGVDEAQSLAYATEALEILDRLAIEQNAVFEVEDARPALLAALGDGRDSIVLQSATTLGRFADAEAQRALADSSLGTGHSGEVRLELLGLLSASARAHGNQLTELHLKLVLDLVADSSGDLAEAASALHGSLNLPTSNGVELIISNN